MIPRMLRVGLTGNIASGKTRAAEAFADLGARVIDADRVAHGLLERGGAAHGRIVETFGEGILDPEGGIDRKRLGNIVFFNEEKRRLLNQITHPLVDREIERRIKEAEREMPDGILVVDAALMVETGGYRRFHFLVVVACNPELQLRRLMQRDSLTAAEAKARMESQMPIAEKLRLAHYTIDTSGTLGETREQVSVVYRDLLRQARRLKSGGGIPGPPPEQPETTPP